MRVKCPACPNWFDIPQEEIDQFIEGAAQRPWRGRFVSVHVLCDRCEGIEQMRDDLDKRVRG
jgi:hypothetical protein